MQELMDPEEGDAEEGDGKKSTLMVTIVGVLIASVIAAGGGWVVGGMLAPDSLEMMEAAQEAETTETAKADQKSDEEEVIPEVGAPGPNLVRLQPITTNLAFPSEAWVRMEVSLVVKSEPDIDLLEIIHQDMLAYLRTLSLQQIQGARGFSYVRDDMKERAVLRSKGEVENILIRTFIIE